MADPQTDLREDLAALLAAARELTPDHDQALVDVFVDHVARRSAAPTSRSQRFPVGVKARRVAAAALLSVAGLGAVSVLSLHRGQPANQIVAPVAAKVVPWKVKMVPMVPRVPLPPPPPKTAP